MQGGAMHLRRTDGPRERARPIHSHAVGAEGEQAQHGALRHGLRQGDRACVAEVAAVHVHFLEGLGGRSEISGEGGERTACDGAAVKPQDSQEGAAEESVHDGRAAPLAAARVAHVELAQRGEGPELGPQDLRSLVPEWVGAEAQTLEAPLGSEGVHERGRPHGAEAVVAHVKVAQGHAAQAQGQCARAVVRDAIARDVEGGQGQLRGEQRLSQRSDARVQQAAAGKTQVRKEWRTQRAQALAQPHHALGPDGVAAQRQRL
mmetsp:Transcript_2546/g.7625  ORF Transcript_2546/g.7625 Transcript_2546/m.7625 type:complete len:261 (+) Transcript_2546:915-1697(+)